MLDQKDIEQLNIIADKIQKEHPEWRRGVALSLALQIQFSDIADMDSFKRDGKYNPYYNDDKIDLFMRALQSDFTMHETDLDIYDVYKTPNGNLFIKMTNLYSLPLGPMGNHEPSSSLTTQYRKISDTVPVTKVGTLIINN